MEKMGIEGSEFANLSVGLNSRRIVRRSIPYSPFPVKFKEDLSEDTARILQAFGIDVKKLAELTGMNIPEGLLDGVEEGMEKSDW